MFIFQHHDEILTSKEYRFANSKSISSRECRNVAAQSSKSASRYNTQNNEIGYDYALAENPQYARLFGKSVSAFYFSKKKGVVLPSYIIEQVTSSQATKGTMTYIEALGSQMTVTIYDANKALLLDSIYDFNSIDIGSALSEVQAALKHSQDHVVTIIYHNGKNSCQEKEVNGLLTLDNARYKTHRISINNPTVELSKEGITCNGLSLGWDELLNDQPNQSESSGSNGVNGTPQSKSIKIRESDKGICTELTVRYFVDETKSLNTKRVTLSRTRVKSAQTRVYGAYFVSVLSFYAAIEYGQYYYHQKNIAAQEALKAAQLTAEDPWHKYRSEITNGKQNLQSEFGLKSLGTVLRVIRSANEVRPNSIPLGWIVSKLEMTGPVMTITPYRSGGNYTQLRNFADQNPAFRLRFGESGPQLDSVTLSLPINESVNSNNLDDDIYITSAEDETAYIADAMNWLFDEIELTTENRIVSGSGEGQYRIHLVKLGFSCWMAEDFIYAGTQMVYRNYGLHSAKLTNQSIARINDKGEMEKNTQCDFGYSGEIYLKVFGK